jgi:lipoprotein-anchoring transpeptidase ErfK/SrfK
MMRRALALLFALLLGAGLSPAAAPVFAAQDSGSQDSGATSSPATVPAAVPGGIDLFPLPSIAPSITETFRFRPELPRNSGVGRRVVYSNSLQWVWAIDKDENVVRSMPVSGRRGVPAAGTYKVTSQSTWSYSLDFEGVDFRWMTRFAKGPAGGNIGFHEIPRKDGKAMQTEAQLGSFAGSGCIRMTTMDVKFLYQWAKLGTPVVVTR